VTPVGEWRRVDLVSSRGVGGHGAKFAKGRFARWLIQHPDEDLTTWRDDGWRVRIS
jgi:hypothetical protein